ncbi:hypothetical protein OPKNFCMD_6103 [Methylobacterium crusticola]|uniref:Uncharacterized protein n=1 Tax=Methylobacterium crusticola TaxID=1697972 RepID=A0ABQ4R6P6_9HYPH|nr:hypothetical protein [Methylobacterium crusticola]GJD53328.1 hypothetical protein OPKNFCMD_6103 [Methylobacterium crusticola]
MTKTILLLAGTMALAATTASAQTARENFSYKAPSGMFSEGTTKWEMYRFMNEDAERRSAPAPVLAAPPGAAAGRYTVAPAPGQRSGR